MTSSSYHRYLRFTPVFLLVFVASVFALNDEQQKQLDQAANYLKSAEADLSSAAGSAGTADRPATGSRLKLTKMRLDSAAARLAQAREVLSDLPADDEAVSPVSERAAKAATEHERLTSIITPKPKAPVDETSSGDEAKADDAPAADPEKPAPRLHYKQEESLKNGRFHLRASTQLTDQALVVLTRYDGEGPKPVHAEIKAAIEKITQASAKLKLAAGYLKTLPGDHPDVIAFAREGTAENNRMLATHTRLAAIDQQLSKITDMASYPDYQKDFDLVGDLGRRYNDFEMVVQQPERLAQIIQEDGSALQEIQRIAKTYIALAEQKTAPGLAIEKRVNWFYAKRAAFAEKAFAYHKQLPELFEKHIAEVMKLANDGVENKKPMYFGANSGISQQLTFAEQKLTVLSAFNSEQAKPYQAKLIETRATLRKMAKSLESEIIANNPLPTDRYKGEDRADLIRRAVEGWQTQQKNAQVLTARIPAEAWNRETKWQWWRDSWQKVDRSRIQIQLIIKHDNTHAIIRPVNLYKNHMKGDTITASPFYSIDDELQPDAYLLLNKVK